MPAQSRPARQMLQEANGPFWARFDTQWYRHTYAADLGTMPDDLAGWYLDHGQALGHSPNPWFDESHYRQRYPDVVAAMRHGACESGFDSYCRGGYLDRSAHWLFDLAAYQHHSPGLALDDLVQADFHGHYDHFLKHGAAEHRVAHLLFDAATYLDALPAETRAAAEQVGAWCHYVCRRAARGEADADADAAAEPEPEPPTSAYFRPDWYRGRYPDAAALIAAAAVSGALHHYLTNETPTAYDPLEAFSEAFYLHRFPDIHDAVRRGDRRNGYAHFLSDGVFELRQPAAEVDLRYYADAHPGVGRDLKAGRVRDAFAHYLLIGAPAGLPASPPAAGGLPDEASAKALFRARAALLLPLLARAPLDFTVGDDPAISVVMVLRDQFALTMQALASLRQNYPGDIELLLVDSGSTDETLHLRRYVTGARLLRFDLNIGYVRGCNAAMYSVTAPHVLLLNNDIELAPGAVSAALRRLADPTVGAVGGRIVRTHGLLQEAGGIVWRDGSTAGYLRDSVALAPEANFARDVDYCSAAFLMVRGDLLQKLEGFDVDYAPAYYEDTDLCLRIAGEGLRVVYDPAVTVHHLEYGSSTDTDAGAQMLASRAIFVEKHADVLARRHPPDPKAVLFARARDANRRRLLFIEDTVPARRLGSGFVRANDIITLIAGFGMHVTVFPINGIQTDVAGAFADLPDTVEVMHDQSIDTLPAFLARRQNYYDTVWIARTHNLDRSLGVLQPWLAEARLRPRVVLDTEAVASLRAAEHALLVGDDSFSVADALAAEFRNAGLGDAYVAVTEQEAETLRGMELSPVSVIGHVRELALTSRPYAERAGMLFVGAIHAMDSPNYDSLCWFIDEVLPLIEAELGWETRLTVIGHTAADVSLERFADHARVTLRGSVPDVRPAYDSHRVFVAPTRYAAGAAYKVHEAASFGLPVVASELIRGQLGWENGQDLLSASSSDPAAFAAAVLRIYRSPPLWEHLRSGAAGRILAENERPAYEAALQEVLAVAAPGDNVMPFPRALRAAPL